MHMTQVGSIAQSLQKVKANLLLSVSSEAEDVPRELLYKLSCMTASLALTKLIYFHLGVALY